MGFFDFFKRKNKIYIDFDISTEPLFVYPTNKIKIGMMAEVPADCELFLCADGKILDCFGEGEHVLSLANLPKCDKKFRLSKPDKDGRLQKYFFCDVYFVNKVLFRYKDFKCYRKALVCDRQLGDYKVGICGGYAFKICNSKKFLSNMLCEYNRLKNKEVEKILSGFVGEYVLGEIEKGKFGIVDFLYTDKMVDALYQDINKKLEFLGVEFLGFDIKECKLPRRLRLTKENVIDFSDPEMQQEINDAEEDLKKNQIKTDCFETPCKHLSNMVNQDDEFVKSMDAGVQNFPQSNVDQGNALKNTNAEQATSNNINLDQSNALKNINIDQSELLHFGRVDLQERSKNVENFDNTKNFKKNLDFDKINVDNKNNLDYSKNTVVRCLLCGFENPAERDTCALCGQPIKRKGKFL